MKKLLIVESPAKTKTISKFLGKDFKIMSTMGHVKDLPTKTLGVHINNQIKIDYVVLEGKEKTIADICKEAGKADVIFLAPDPDREGEIIAWHVMQEIIKVAKTDKIYRIAFNEITKSAIEDAISSPASIDEHKVAAQQARRVLDRWVGYEVSPILWRKITKGLSAGRVQSVALKFICDREDAIRGFKSEEYWSIDADFKQKNIKISAPLTHIKKKKAEIQTEAQALEIVKQLKNLNFNVSSIKDSKRIKNAPAPFMTSTLQQNAYNQLGFSVQRTMQVAQKLYEGIPLEDKSTPVALITYMRTDSLRISDVAIKQVRDYIDTEFGRDYLPSKTNFYSKGKAQDAHEAIRPIDVNITPSKAAHYLPVEAAKLYELIWKRFVSCQMKPAIYAQRQVSINSTDDLFIFKVTGSTLIFDGYLKAYTGEDDVEKDAKIIIPKELSENMPLDLDKTDLKQHFTQPPARFTEASLVKELEKEGIGRPSTYATILKTIQARSYTTVESKKFIPTELGMMVTKMLKDNLPHIMNTQFTALMEEDLDKIANGELERDKLLMEFYTTFEKDLAAFSGGQAKKLVEATNITCPQCNQGQLVIRMGKMGAFLGCNKYPECQFTSNFERTVDGTIVLANPEVPKLLEEQCNLCKKQLRKVKGRFGEFVACSGYPECKYIHQNKASFKCLACKEGDVVEKNWKGKKFWGCSNYPKCKFSIAGEIEESPCPSCSRPFLSKRSDKDGNIKLTCSSKECGYKNT